MRPWTSLGGPLSTTTSLDNTASNWEFISLALQTLLSENCSAQLALPSVDRPVIFHQGATSISNRVCLSVVGTGHRFTKEMDSSFTINLQQYSITNVDNGQGAKARLNRCQTTRGRHPDSFLLHSLRLLLCRRQMSQRGEIMCSKNSEVPKTIKISLHTHKFAVKNERNSEVILTCFCFISEILSS